jgi:hypothetical protein
VGSCAGQRLRRAGQRGPHLQRASLLSAFIGMELSELMSFDVIFKVCQSELFRLLSASARKQADLSEGIRPYEREASYRKASVGLR